MRTDEPGWDVPIDRQSRIADRMSEAFDADPEHREGDMCIIFVDDDKSGTICIYGYEDTSHAMTHLLIHLQSIFAANGKKLDLMFMDEEGIDRVDGP